MKIDDTTFESLARLAKIEISSDKKAVLEQQLNSIVEFVEQLQEVDTDGLEPTHQINGLESITREDSVREEPYHRETMLATMPDTTGDGYLRVHAIFDKKNND